MACHLHEEFNFRPDLTRLPTKVAAQKIDHPTPDESISNISKDLTEKRRTEAALIESERLAAISRLTATISHEVNNPLEAVMTLAYLLQEHPSLDAEAKGYTKMLIEEVLRVNEITKQTLSYYRDTSGLREVDVVQVMEGVLRLHRSRFHQKSVQVDTRYREPVMMMAQAGDLRQVFLNLVLNAVDALPKEGTLRIRICSKPGRDVRVSVADNGPVFQRAFVQESSNLSFPRKRLRVPASVCGSVTPSSRSMAAGFGCGLDMAHPLTLARSSKFSYSTNMFLPHDRLFTILRKEASGSAKRPDAAQLEAALGR